MMNNYREIAKEMLKEFKKDGFRGVRCHVELEGSEVPEPDEQTAEELAEFNKNYAVFIIDPQFDFRLDDAPFVQTTINSDLFYRELKDYFREKFGDCKIEHHVTCREFEIIRKIKKAK